MECISSEYGVLCKARNVVKKFITKKERKSIKFLFTCVLRRIITTERMVVLGEIYLSAFLQALFQSMLTPLFDDFFRGQEREEMKQMILGRLNTTLLTISAMLIDADEKLITNQAVKEWLNKLKDAVYHAEDVLDDINTEASLAKETTKLEKWLDFNKVDLKPKLTYVTKTVENLASQFSLSLNVATATTHKEISTTTTSLIGKQNVIGREAETEEIVDFLINEDNINISVVAIVGIGGVGKTALAQLVYNEERIKKHFEVKVWIHVSKKAGVFILTKTIYESVTSIPFLFEGLDKLHVDLHTSLKGKEFLLVLDDIWSETFEDWNLLCQPFSSAAKARIIVTTRSHHVAKNVCASYDTRTHTLKPLPIEDCLGIFMEQVLVAKDQVLNRELGTLADEVVKKCQGLPLAAKAFGGLLRLNREVDYWRQILNSKIWTDPTDSTNILSVLQVSYHYLPHHLKRCFAYCSIFPKGYAFDKKMVVLFWMSEGLLQQESTEKMEKVGAGYFEELVSRSLFQRDSTDTTKFTMHDLVNELAQFAAGEFCFKYENEFQGITAKTRHLSYLRNQYSGEARKFKELSGAKYLRTFLPLSIKETTQICCLNKMVSHKLLPNLTCLRVLSLSNYNIPKLPSDIFEKMRHVRYLDLSYTNLSSLPTSVCFLYNLQTLLLAYCLCLSQLDKAICKLTMLEHIDLTATTSLKQMPEKIGRLKRLHTLTTFVVTAGKGAKISALGDLTKLRGKLTILDLHKVEKISDAEEAELESKKDLKEIDFTWRTTAPVMDQISATHDEDAIFEKLRPSNGIETLIVKKYYGNSFPAWMSDRSFSSIVSIHLTECQRCTSMPSLGGLPGLKELHISQMRDLRSIGSEFYTSHPESNNQDQQPFRSLEMLTFEDMPNWNEWVDVEVYGGTLFPKLQELFIVRCPQLTSALPGSFPSLISLHTTQSEGLVFQLDADKYPKLQRLN